MNIPEITDADLAFGTTVGLPDYETIDKAFNWPGINKWVVFVDSWFSRSIEELKFMPKEGIDPDKAFRHLRALLITFAPKHEHKMAGIACLCSQYFTDVCYRDRKGVTIPFDTSAETPA